MQLTSFANRDSMVKKIKDQVFDLAIIGGGITGAGILRDAAMRGMRVCLIEKNDFASGTSSRSSKLVHGGLRYLENLEFDLVSEALHERQYLLEMAPHMVKPLRFLMPIYKGDRVGMFKMGAGMTLYDALSSIESTKLHELVDPQDIKEKYQKLKTEGLQGGYLYSDALMDDDRLVYETLRSATNYGGLSLSYSEVIGYKDGELEFIDHLEDKKHSLAAKHVISAAGPWTDDIGYMMDGGEWREKMRPSKGIHITLPKNILNLDSAVVMGADAQKRILFCIPREGFDIVGTTDTDYDGDPANVYATKDDVQYVLRILKDYYPDVEIKSDDIISTYAGVRPLVNDGSASESKVSRDHWVHTDLEKNITYISGGKYTTYLSMAEHCIDHVLNESTLSSADFKKTNTRIPFVDLNVRENFEHAHSKLMRLAINLSEEEKNDFFDSHGPQALTFIEKYFDEAMSLPELEAKVAIHEYFCGSILDFYTRRVSYILSLEDHGENFLHKVKEVFKKELSLSEDQLQKQIDAYYLDVKNRKKSLLF